MFCFSLFGNCPQAFSCVPSYFESTQKKKKITICRFLSHRINSVSVPTKPTFFPPYTATHRSSPFDTFSKMSSTEEKMADTELWEEIEAEVFTLLAVMRSRALVRPLTWLG
jgi:hypothetical protein